MELTRAVMNIIEASFMKTKHAEILRRNVRFGDFKPKNISNEFWCEILGPDANNLYHAQVMADIVSKYSEYFCLGPKISDKLYAAAIMHDWAEAIVGDISGPKKTDRDKAIEKHIFLGIIQEIAPDFFEQIENIADKIIFAKNKEAGLAFHFWVCENVGYFRTGIKAWRKSKELDEINPNLSLALKHLALEIVVGNLSRKVPMARRNSFLANELRDNSKTIAEIILQSGEIYSTHPSKTTLTELRLNNSIRFWNTFIAN